MFVMLFVLGMKSGLGCFWLCCVVVVGLDYQGNVGQYYWYVEYLVYGQLILGEVVELGIWYVDEFDDEVEDFVVQYEQVGD